jgi:hypothetical protein
MHAKPQSAQRKNLKNILVKEIGTFSSPPQADLASADPDCEFLFA